MRTGRCVSPAPLASSNADVGPRAPRRSGVSRSDLEIELEFWPYDCHRAIPSSMRFHCTPLFRSTSARCLFPFPSSIFLFTGTTKDICLLPIMSGSVTVSKKPPLPSAPKPPPSVLEPPSPPASAPLAAEPHPPAAAAPHARVPTGPTPVAPVAPVAPVESLVPIVVVDAPPGALILDAPLVSVALRAPVAAVGSSPHAVSATTGGPGPGEVGGGALRYRLPSYRLRRHRCCPRTSRWFLILRRSQLLPWLSVRHLRAAGSIGRTLLRPGTSERRRGGDTILLGAKGPRRTGLHPVAVAVAGGGGRGRGGGWAYDRPVTMADLQRFVSDAMRLERNGQAS
ncbi:unnamed protein product [Closterium sp. NIES-54]